MTSKKAMNKRFFNKVVVGKVENILPKIEDCSIDLIIADPPFNKGKHYDGYDDNMSEEDYMNWVDAWIKEGFRVLKDTGSFWIYCPSSLLGNFQTIGKQYGMWQNTVCWNYIYGSVPDEKRLPKIWSAWLFFSKTDKFQFFAEFHKSIESITTRRKNINSKFSDVWDDIPKLVGGYLAQSEVLLYPKTKKRICVYQLPILLLKRIIGLCSQEGDLVLDLFSHSGTTSTAAKIMNRNYLAIDQSKKYCEIIEGRINKLSKTLL